MKKQQKLLALGLAAMLTVSLTACGGNANNTTTTASTTQATTAATTKATTAATTETTTEAAKEPSYEGMEFVVFSQMDLTKGGNEDSWYFQGVIHHALDEWCLEHGATWSQMLTNDTNVLMASIAAGKAPDLYFSYKQWPLVANLGLVQPITEYYDELADKYGADFLEIMKYQGEYYGINAPWNEMTVIQYDRTRFEEMGVKTPREYWEEGNWTWETFYEVCKAVTKDTDGDGGNNTVGIGIYQGTSCFAPSIAVDANGNLSSLLNTDKNREFYQMIYEGFTLDQCMTKANQGVGEKDGVYQMMSIVACDIYDPSGLYKLTADGNVIESVPVPVWKEDDPDVFTKTNFFQFAVPTGAKSLEASVSLLDYVIEAACAIEMIPSGMTNYEFTGLRGTTEESKAYIEFRNQQFKERKATVEAIPEYDEAYVAKILSYIDGTPKMIEASYSGVTYPLTNIADSAFWSNPAATAIAEMYPTHQAACETYNSKYIFK